MINRRFRKCYCMNNNYFNSQNSCPTKVGIETACNNTNCCCSQNNLSDSCDCGFDDEEENVFPENPMLGQSYVPLQQMNDTFKPCVGLKHGTIFPELVSPYSPCDSMRQIAFIESLNTPKEGCNS